MKIACVIPTLASEVTKPYLKLAVESLRATVDWDIFVVSNGTKDKPDLRDIKGITAHLHTRDQGQCVATNIGAQLASPDTDYLFISNDDMYYNNYANIPWSRKLRFDYPVFSPNLVEPMNNNGSAAPFIKTIDPGNTIEEFNKNKEHIDFIISSNTVLTGEDIKEEPGFNLPFFIKKDFWQKLGGYDIAFDPWGSNSDTDLQTRINLAGVTPMRLRDVLVYHFSNKSGTFDGTHQDFYQNNIDYFKDKHGFDRDELGSDVWYNKDMLPKDVSKIKQKRWQYV